MIENKTLNEIQNELVSLQERAKKIGYKNIIPKIPQGKKLGSEPPEHLLAGFNLRLSNWINGLIQLENNLNPPPQNISRIGNPTGVVNDNLSISTQNN